MRILIIALSLMFTVNLFAANTQYPRVMGCQTPGAFSYIEIFHDQAGFMGAPKNPTGFLVIWSTVLGKDTQKRLVLDVPMKHVATGANSCVLDLKWSQRASDGANAISNFHAEINDACNMMILAPKGKITEDDVYSDGKVVTTSATLDCQLQ